MRKIAFIILVLTMAFLVVSCGGDVCENHIDADKNGKCDECNAEVETNETPSEENNNNTENTTYTVYVKNEAGDFVPNVEIQIFEGSTPKGTATTNADGAASVSFKPIGKIVKVMLSQVPEGYVLPDDFVASFDNDETEVTVTLEPEIPEESYTVHVEDQTGAPAANVLVQICQGNTCFTGKYTDENGDAVFSFIPNGEELKVQISDAPEDYSYTSGYIATFEEGQTEVTVTITVAVKIRFTVIVTNEDGNAMSGVTVHFYDGESFMAEVITDENGCANFDTDPNATISAKITSVPRNYEQYTDIIELSTMEAATVVIKRSSTTILPIQPFN